MPRTRLSVRATRSAASGGETPRAVNAALHAASTGLRAWRRRRDPVAHRAVGRSRQHDVEGDFEMFVEKELARILDDCGEDSLADRATRRGRG